MTEKDERNDEVQVREYFALLDTVAAFDQRLLVIKGWGVTLSLAALGWGFQFRSYGSFLVAAVGSASFWILEATVKRHQMRYYPRMREIEYQRFVLAPEEEKASTAPCIDWSWATAGALLREGKKRSDVKPPGATRAYRWMLFAPHVCLPHVLTFAAALILFALGSGGALDGFSLGASPPK